jgi:muramidase (phage lysozyme)
VNATYNKDEQITFDVYKTVIENLWLKAECQGTKKYEGDYLKKDGEYFVIGKKCECEARIRAFMRVIRVAEGTGEYFKGTHDARDPQLGYTTWFSGSGKNFTLSDDHPRTINHNSKKTVYSSAAGAYQTMSWKFDELNGYKLEPHNKTYRTIIPKIYIESQDKAKKYDAKGFSEASQDKLCVIILKDDIKVINALLKKDIKSAISKSSGTWVSLPGATAGQPTAKMQETLDYYDEFLKAELSGKSNLHIKKGFLKEFDIKCNCKNEKSNLETNEFGLVQVTKLGNPYIINSGTEDSYSYTKKDGTLSSKGKHGDDWMLPEKAQAFSDAVYKLVKEYPKQKIYLGDCSAYNPSNNLGHSVTGAHSNGNAFDCRFLKSDGSGSNDISNLTADEIKLSGIFVSILKESGLFKSFYTDNGKIPGSVHSADHKDHIHGN